MKKVVCIKIEFDEKDNFDLDKVNFALVERIMKQAEIIGKPNQPKIELIGEWKY